MAAIRLSIRLALVTGLGLVTVFATMGAWQVVQLFR